MTLYNPFKKTPVPVVQKADSFSTPTNPEEEYQLGWRLASGQGTAKDVVLAYRWLTMAARHGHERAGELKDTIAERMTASELWEAERQLQAPDSPSATVANC